MSTVTSLGFSIMTTYNGRGVNKAKNDVTSLSSKVGGMAKSIGSIAMKAALPVAAIAAESIKSATAFQSSMKKIQTQAGASAKDVATLSKQVLSLAPSTQQGPEQLSEALYHLKSVGMDNVDAMKALATASDLAAVGGADLESTTNALAGAWRTGIKGAETFAQTAATVNAVIGAGNMKMEDFTAAIGTGILPSAKTFGLSMSQVGAALALFTDEGVPAQAAATRLRMSISLLGAPSKAAEKVLGDIGVSGLDLANAMRGKDGIIGAIGLLKEHLDASGLSASKQAILLSHAFGGGRSSSAILSMINNFDVLVKKQNQVNASMGKYGPAVAAQRKTAEAQFKILKSNLETLSIELGTKLLPPVVMFVSWITQTGLPIVDRFSSAIADIIPVDAIKSKVSQAEAAISGMLKQIGADKVFNLLTGKKQKTTYAPFHLPEKGTRPTIQPGVTQSQANKLNSTLNPSKGVKSGENLNSNQSKALSSAGKANPGGLMNTGENMSMKQANQLAKGPSQAKGIADSITDVVKNLDAKKIGSVLGSVLGTALMLGLKVMAKAGQMIEKVMKEIDWVSVGKSVGGQALGFAIGFLTGLGADLFTKDFWTKHWLDVILAALSIIEVGKIAGPLGRLFERIPVLKVFTPFLHGLEALSSPFVKVFDGIWQPVKKGFIDGFTKVFPESRGMLGKLIEALVKPIQDLGATLYLKGLYALEALGSGFGTAGAKILQFTGKFIKELVGLFPTFVLVMLTVGHNVSIGLLKGIASGLVGIYHWVEKEIFKPILNAFEGLFQIHSPSKVFFGLGKNIILGLINGILAGVVGIGKWIAANVVNPIKAKFADAKSWLYDKGRSIVSGLKSGISVLASGLGKWINDNVKSPIKGAFKTASTLLYGKGRDVINGFWDGLKEPWHDVQTWVSGVAEWIKKHKGPISLDRKLLVPAGKALMEGLLNGLKVGFKGVGSFVHKTGTTVADTVSGIGSDLFGGGGPDNKGYDAAAVGSSQKFAKSIMGNYNWGSNEFGPLKALWNGESGWKWWAKNSSSGAYGIPQALPAQKMAAAGSDWRTNPRTQILWGLNYIKDRYGTPAEAYSKWLSRSPHWYANGTPGAPRGPMIVGERGPELLMARGGESITPAGEFGGDHYHFDFRGAHLGTGMTKKDFENMLVAANRDLKRKGRSSS